MSSTPVTAETLAESATLTKLDLAAMRQADSSVSFNHLGKRDDSPQYASPGANGVGRIRCCKKVANPGPYDDSDREYTIDCESTVSDYDSYDANYKPGNYKAFALDHFPQNVHGPWPAVCAFVRVGDILSLHWVACNNNAHSKKAGLYVDRVELRVERTTRGGMKKRFTFILDHRVNPGDSARMVQPY